MVLEVFGVEARTCVGVAEATFCPLEPAAAELLALVDSTTGCLLWPRDARVDRMGIMEDLGVGARCVLRCEARCAGAVRGVLVEQDGDGVQPLLL